MKAIGRPRYYRKSDGQLDLKGMEILFLIDPTNPKEKKKEEDDIFDFLAKLKVLAVVKNHGRLVVRVSSLQGKARLEASKSEVEVRGVKMLRPNIYQDP